MDGIDNKNWRAISAALDELLDADSERRAARLAQVRRDDPALAEQLATLLAQQSAIEVEHFLEDSPVDPVAFGTLEGRSFGGYTLERPLGQGGMGSVWLARRSDGRYEGRAAVKLLNLGLLGQHGAQRLTHEATALARLAHPNITHLIDAGVEAGQPYLVLEYVEGEPIDRWCDARKLDVAARIRLFTQVLAAVAHAHGRLILHRDLKPSNILVTADGRVKLLDFGIAKLLEANGQTGAPSELTKLGAPLTPEYAAPEQVERVEVTTATDVYALGVLLHFLLVGTHPTAGGTTTPLERMRALVEREPTRPSEAVGEMSAELVQARQSSSRQLQRTLSGDLDNIVAKALKKAPAERYATADAFGSDLWRYLDHEPVEARADSIGYRMGKFVRRHRLAMGGASALLLALLAGIVGTSWQAYEAGIQRARALEQRDRAHALLGRNEAIIDFVDLMFTQELATGEALAIQRMFERSETMIDEVFAGQPEQQAELLRVLASYYTILDQPEPQLALTQRALQMVGPKTDISLQAELACIHAGALMQLGRHEEAGALQEKWTNTAGVEPNVAAYCLQTRARLAQQLTDAAGAARFAETGLQRLREAEQPNRKTEATLLGDLAFAHHLMGKNRDADRHYQQAFDRLTALGRQHSHYSQLMLVDWALVRYAMGDFKRGVEMFDQALGLARRVQGNAPVQTAIVANRAFGLEQLGRYAEALTAYEDAHTGAQASGFPAGMVYALVGQASVRIAIGDLAGAAKSLSRAASMASELPEAHAVRIRHAMVQAQLQVARGESSTAMEAFSRVIALMTSNQLVHPALANAYRQRAELEAARGDSDSARNDAQRALDLARTLQGGNEYSDLTGRAWLTLGGILREAGENDAADAALASAEANLLHTLGADHADVKLVREQRLKRAAGR